MKRVTEQEARAAWDRIEALGGHGVWDKSMVVVSFAGSQVTDDDLKVFDDIPHVQILDLSGTSVGDDGLEHISRIPSLEDLIIVGTRISDGAIERFRSRRPDVTIKIQPTSKNAINPFTGKPFGP